MVFFGISYISCSLSNVRQLIECICEMVETACFMIPLSIKSMIMQMLWQI